jgi:outer membrane lipoprotein-sorting protein
VQKRILGSIGGSEIYNGEVYFQHTRVKAGAKPADKVRLTYTSGGKTTQDLLVDGDVVKLHQPGTHQLFVTSLEKQAGKRPEYGFIGSPYVSVPNLRNKYDVSYVGDEAIASSQTAVLKLVPKTTSEVKWMNLWVDRSSYLPIQYQVHQANGDVSTTTLGHVENNIKIDAVHFKLTWPSDTTIINQ